jgi:polyhydroxyalkanoate synthesis regulator phasin
MTLFSDERMNEMLADLARREAQERVERVDEVVSDVFYHGRKSGNSAKPHRERRTAVAQDVTASWQAYITGEVRAAERRMLESAMSATGEVLVKERAERTRLEAEVTALKLEVAELRGRIIERGEAASASRLKVVPAGMIA